MKKFFYNTIVILLIFLVHTSPGQQYKSQAIFTTDQGLSQNSVQDILQDSKGFLWFGTKDGLNRYDGYIFTAFRRSAKTINSLTNNRIRCIEKGRQGALWIGTDEGLNKFEPSKGLFTGYLYNKGDKNSLSENTIISLLEDRSGMLWIGTRKGLNRMNTANGIIERVNIPRMEQGIPGCSQINSIFQSSDSSLWFGTSGCGLFRFDGATSTWSQFTCIPSDSQRLSSNSIGPMLEDKSGKIWIGTYGGGLCMFDPAKTVFQRFSGHPRQHNNVRGMYINALIHLNDSSIVVVGRNAIDLLHCTSYEVSDLYVNEQPSAYLSVLKDQSGILWIGTDGYGIYKLIPVRKLFKSVWKQDSFKTGLSISSVRLLYEDSDRNMWVGGYVGLNKRKRRTAALTRHGKNEWEVMEILGGATPFCMIEEPGKQGVFWFGTEGAGVIRYNSLANSMSRYSKYNRQSFFPSAYCSRIIVTHDNELYFGAGAGLCRWNPDTSGFDFFAFDPNDSTSINEGDVKALCEDSEGKLWVGTTKSGVSIFDPATKRFERFSSQRQEPKTLSDNHVNVIHRDNLGGMWVGTAAGLNKFIEKERKFISYNVDDGLPNDCIYGILEDERGYLWLSTNRGISMFNPEEENFTNYDRFDGLQGDEFNSLAYFKSSNGELFFGGTKGFTSFYPREIVRNPNVPRIVITGFKRFNQHVNIQPPLEFATKIDLSYSDYVFSFEFAALEFTEPAKNTYAYMMAGFDDAWRMTTSEQRIATYTNLDAGEYVFKVKASNNDGVWNEAGTSLKVIIAPPVWQTWWFRFLGIGVAAGVILGIYKFRINSLHQQREAKQKFARQLIESQEAERKRIASEMHDAVGQDLLIIKNLSFMALEENNVEEKKNYLNEISQTASQTIEDVRKISHNLRPFQLDKLGMTKALESLLATISKTSSIRFTYDIESIDGIFPRRHEIHIYRMLQECLNNIIKHSQAHEAIITVRKSGIAVELTVKDDGKGFTIEGSENVLHSSQSFGLSGLSERVTILGGKLSISSKPQKGTLVFISLPCSIMDGEDTGR